jgi:MATE family multidrug resistance protein
VWGPESIRLGFIGAPIASAISFNLVSLMSFAYGTLFVSRAAWHPLSRQSFMNLGILVQLGLSGVGMSILPPTDTLKHSIFAPSGQVASEWWSWELVALAASM